MTASFVRPSDDRPSLRFEVDDLSRPAVRALLSEHLTEMRAVSPPESTHALPIDELAEPGITVWTVWAADELLGCGAVKQLDRTHGEIKAMRTTQQARGRGVASRLLAHLIEQAQHRGYTRLSLETGAEPFFEPARQLYGKHGFVECSPFGDYEPDPNSVFLTRNLASRSSPTVSG